MGPSTEFAASPMSQTKSLRAVQNGGDPSCYIDRSYTQTPHVFYRWYHRHASGYDLDTACQSVGSCANGAGGSKTFYAKSSGGYQVYYFIKPFDHTFRVAVPHSFYSRLCPNGKTDSECVYEQNVGSVPIEPSATYCIETELDRGSPGVANGVIRMWVNGTLVIQYTNAPIAKSDEGSTNWNQVTYYTQGGYGIRHIDDLVVGDTRIGCGAISFDTVAPNSPTGLIVR